MTLVSWLFWRLLEATPGEAVTEPMRLPVPDWHSPIGPRGRRETPRAPESQGDGRSRAARLDRQGQRYLSLDVVPPVLLQMTAPEYPVGALADGVEGEIELALLVTSGGHTKNVQVLKPLDPRLDEAAARAAEKWSFQPATLYGESVEFGVNLTFRFRLSSRAVSPTWYPSASPLLGS